jgi:uncharacterized membrane protein (GlpM family)
MSEALKLVVYFVLGGTLVTASVYFGEKGRGLAAAFISQFPSMTVLTFYLIYRSGGNTAVVDYAKGFLYVVPPWILYVLIVYFLCARIGPLWSLALGVGTYMLASFALAWVKSLL